MSQSLRVLLIEDNADDAKIVLRELNHAGFEVIAQRVDTEAAFLHSLQGNLDFILSDYTLPGFDGMRALELLNKSGLEVPFIIVSGSIGEEIAVEAMKQGAADYLLKDRLARLGPAVHRALEQARLRKERLQTQEDLRATHLQLRQLLEHSPVVLYALRVEGQNIIPYMVSENFTELLGFPVPETPRYEWWLGQLHPDDRDRVVANISKTLTQGTSLTEYRLRHKDGSYRWVEDNQRVIHGSSNEPLEIVGVWTDITERKRAKETLRQSEERFRQLAENITDVFWICSPDLQKVLYVSPAYERVWGRSAERLREHPQEWFEAILPEERERVAATYGRLTNGEPSVSLEYRITRPGGEVRWIHSRGFQVRDAAGKVIRITGVASDINDRKLAEAELLWKTAFLEAQVDSSLDGILVVNSKGKQLLRNQRMNQLWKIPPDFHTERNDRKLLQFVAAKVKNPEAFIREVENLYAHPDEVSRVEVELIDGTILDRYSSPVVGIDGTFYGRIWAFRDVTDSKQAERRLATQSAISRAIADSNTSNEAMPKIVQAICESEGWDFGAIWEVNKESNRLRCLETWQRPECPAEEFAARTRALTFASNVGLPGRVWASGKPMLISNVADDNNYPRAPLAIKIGLRSALAFPIVLEGDVIGVMDFLGQEIRATDEKMLEMFLDIGLQIGAFFKRKKLEEQYRQSQKMEGIGQLAGGVAHDFNNILAAIQMQSDLLKSSGGLSDDQSAFADEIGVTVQRAAALTRQLLLFSRREVFQPRDLDLGESIANTIKMLRRILGENVRIQLKIASQPMFIHADAGMMDQILLNLVVNARDAMPNGGQLVIETSGVEFDHCAGSHSAQMRLGSFVCLSVSDSGCGMAPEILPRIFEPFFTTKEIGKGTGLGLATVFGIVQQHQGWIDVYSELDHGTTFRVYLPRLAKNAGSKSSQSPPTAVRGGCETILLAEDDPSLRLYVRKAVSQFGYRVLEAPTGVKALEVWKENRDEIRLLLTDLLMPGGMNGKDLAQQLLQENAKLKVIYMSGYGAEVVGKDFPLKEGDNFLSKPFKALKLAQTIREKLDEKN